ncbi:MAG: hypothetical protein ABI193_08030 [Minicystis sp.]
MVAGFGEARVGMLTLGPSPRSARGYDPEIPNRVIRELQWEHLALTLRDEAQVEAQLDDLRDALAAMAVEGEGESGGPSVRGARRSLPRGMGICFWGFRGMWPGRAGTRRSWLLELKYLQTGAKAAQIEAAFAEAEGQLARYAGDRTLKAGRLVPVEAKKVLFRAWEPAGKKGKG